MDRDGRRALEAANWLLGFDFDGTLADIDKGYSVDPIFFQTIGRCQQERKLAWGICTGRSLEFLLEGLENADCPFYPDYIVSTERDIFYHDGMRNYEPDSVRNEQAMSDLLHELDANKPLLDNVNDYVTRQTNAEWVSIPGDPAGIIATSVDEVQEVVDLFNANSERSIHLDYQRNTIYLRFTHKEYCKGTAVQYLQSAYTIDYANTLVMGDNYNDLSMLNPQVAKHYGAPANAIQTLKEALAKNGGFLADRPTAHGVSEAILERLTP